MNKLSLLVVALMISGFANAQITFQKLYGDSGIYSTLSTIETYDGGYLIAGQKSGTGSSGCDIFFIKTNSVGDTMWTKTFGGAGNDYCYSVRQTSDSGFIAIGSTNSFGNGIYLVKTSINGSFLWSRVFGNTGFNEGYSVEQTSDGGYIITGEYDTGSGSLAICLIKTNNAGNLTWTNLFEGAWGSSVQQTFDGGFVLTGVNINDICLIKTDSLGSVSWWKTFGTTSNMKSYSVKETTDGGYIIGGYVFNGVARDVSLIKTDANGDTLWTKSYGGTGDFICYSMEQTTDGGYLIAGAIDTTLSFTYDVLLLKTDSLGNIQWSRDYGDFNYAFTHTAIQTSDGGFLIGGIYNDIMSTGNTYSYLIKTDSLGISGCNEINVSIIPTNYVTQINTNGNIIGSIAIPVTSPTAIIGGGCNVITLCTTVGIETESIKGHFELIISPNPSLGSFIISFDKILIKGNVTVANILGETIFAENILNESKKEINLKNVSDGIYFVKVFNGEKSHCKKLIVEHD